MEQLDATIIMMALPQMAASFEVRAIDLSIGITAYMITLAVFIPASGWAADRWGTRRVYFLAIIGFTLASVLCGMSQTMWQFTGSRHLQGLAAAMVSAGRPLVVFRRTVREGLGRGVLR